MINIGSISMSVGIGCIGVGKHLAHIKGADTPIYRLWRAMLRRCYYRRVGGQLRKSYNGVTVCKDWLNFQNFADWYEDNYPTDGMKYELDKDIKKPNNLIYGPDYCLFVTKQDNLKARRFKNKTESKVN